MLSHQQELQQNQILAEHVISNLQVHQMQQQHLRQQLGYSAAKKHLSLALKVLSKLRTEQLQLNVQTKLGSCLHIIQIALVSF